MDLRLGIGKEVERLRAGRVASGKLTVRIARDSQDELGQMAAALTHTMRGSPESVGPVQQATRYLAAGAIDFSMARTTHFGWRG
jgi:methyl-accepting chemotaxis protein